VLAAKGFVRVGDSHELDHCQAALAVGCCHGENCSGSRLGVLTYALESIAHFARGEAGVLATEALIEAGVWSATVETDERAHPVEHWLRHGCGYVPVHDDPRPNALGDALLMGTRVLVGAAKHARSSEHVLAGETAESVTRNTAPPFVVLEEDQESTPDLLDPDGSGYVAEPPWDRLGDDAPQV
jgi:hypothetical protein